MYGRQDNPLFRGKPSLRVLSLGAGVQSSVLALMAARGEMKYKNHKPIKIDCAIFADTGWEPKSVYKHLRWLKKEIKKSKHSFPVIETSVKDLYKRRELYYRTAGGGAMQAHPHPRVTESGAYKNIF